jgi:hypothetical protein
VTDQNGPRHGDDSVYDPNPDTAYDDEYAIDPAMGAAAAGGTAGAASGSAAGADGQDGANGTGGPPLRGLAMVLTAVAVVLIAWGVYSFVGGDGDDTEDTAQDTTTGQGGAGTTSRDGASPASPQDGTDAAKDGAASPSASEGDTAAGDPARDGEGSPDDEAGAGDTGGGEPAAPGVDRGATAVTVLNNSGEPVAQSTADRLRGEQWTNIGYGNLRGRIDGISEESRVYYPEGNAQSQAAAEQVASDLGITAAAGNPDYYDRFGEADVRNGPRADGVVVVLTGPL